MPLSDKSFLVLFYKKEHLTKAFFFEKKKQKTFVCLVTAAVLSGCAVGPNFKVPAPPVSVTSAPTAQKIPDQWWSQFGSATIDSAVNQALTNSPDLASQQAALRAAQEQYRATSGSLYPQISGSLNASRSATTLGPEALMESVGNAQIAASYTLDLWGGTRRNIEEQAANVDQARYVLAESRLTLTASIAQTLISIASLNDQIGATNQIIATEQQSRAQISQQLALGSKTRADLLQQDAQIAQTRTQLPPLAQQLDQAHHQLAALSGAEALAAPPQTLTLDDLHLPEDLPAAISSRFIAQRPDIEQQQALLHARTAAVGVATANMLPSLILSASDGTMNQKINGLVQNGINIWSLGAGLTQPLFEGGTLRALRAEARAQLDQQAATYQQTVLNALSNVASSLTAIDHDRDAVTAASAYAAAAQSSLAFTREQYQIGATDFTTLLTQQQAYQQATLARITAIATQYQDAVGLFQSLGGGWSDQPGATP